MNLKNSSIKVFLTPKTYLDVHLVKDKKNFPKFMTGEKSTLIACKMPLICLKIAVHLTSTLLLVLCKTVFAKQLQKMSYSQLKNSLIAQKAPEDAKVVQLIKFFHGENVKVSFKKNATQPKTSKIKLALMVIWSKTTAEWKTMFTKWLTSAWPMM